MAEPSVRESPTAARPSRLAALKRARGSARATIVFERAWPLGLPILILASLLLTISWFGIFRIVPEWARVGSLVVAACALVLAVIPLRRFRWPSDAEIDRRIERTNALAHTPVLAQADRLAGADTSFATALWREHQKRMSHSLGRLSNDLPRTGGSERDPWGLHAAVLLLLVTGFAFSFGPWGGSISDAFRPVASAAAVPPRIDAWVTPPAYTGRAPILLTADVNREQTLFSVPQGSAMTLRVTGGSGVETLAFAPLLGEAVAIEADAPDPARQQAAGTSQFATQLTRDGSLTLDGPGGKIGEWVFSIVPDQPPTISYLGEPSRALNGTLELTYSVQDDYGPAAARVEFEPVEAPDENARPLYESPDMPLSLPRRNAKDGAAKTSRDLTEHVWAGVPVRARLVATDAAGQEGISDVKAFRLPERPFSNPLARALVEQRRILGLDANRKQRVLDLMEAITLRPEDTIRNAAHWLALTTASTRLQMATTDDQLREVADYLWEIALAIEDGNLSDAERRLKLAQEALKQALENGATDEEIEKLMAELRSAMQEYLREFAARAARDPSMTQNMPNSQDMRQSDLDRMMDQIENLAKSGARDQAQELLSQLQEMMNNLRMAQPQQQGPGQQSEMRQMMDQLGEILRRQQEMMNETHQLDQSQRGQRQRGPNGQQQPGEQGQQGQQGEPGQGMTPEELAEALRQLQEGQGQLRGQLGEMMQGLEGMGIQPGEGFGEAGEAMGEAGDALGQGQGERAVGEQGRALEALRRGAQDMMQQMQQAMQGEDGGGQEGGRQQAVDRDPLGRPRATTGPDFGDTVRVPDEIDVQRARRILEEIRRRLGNALSPEIEKDYLERLLEMR